MSNNFINVSKGSKSNHVQRKDVKFGELFRAKGKEMDGATYAHMGVRTDPPTSGPEAWQSINIDSGEAASSPNGDKGVVIVGGFTIEAAIHEDFS
jgi:hypothetical protein